MGIIKSVRNVENINVDFINKTLFDCADKHTDLLCDELEDNESYSLSLMVETSEYNDATEDYRQTHSDITKNYSSKKVEKLIELCSEFFDSISESSIDDINFVDFGHRNNDRAFFQVEIERDCDYKRVFTFVLNKSKML